MNGGPINYIGVFLHFANLAIVESFRAREDIAHMSRKRLPIGVDLFLVRPPMLQFGVGNTPFAICMLQRSREDELCHVISRDQW